MVLQYYYNKYIFKEGIKGDLHQPQGHDGGGPGHLHHAQDSHASSSY